MSGKKILIIDDAAFMRMTLKDILVKNGYAVCGEGADGFEAVEKYGSLLPDLVIMDMSMPNMDGIAALKIIKKDYPGAKIIMCSAMGHESDIDRAKNSGADGFIAKPYRADQIKAAVAEVLK